MFKNSLFLLILSLGLSFLGYFLYQIITENNIPNNLPLGLIGAGLILMALTFRRESKIALLSFSHFVYTRILKPILFKFDPETVHTKLVIFGEFSGKSNFANKTVRSLIQEQLPELTQELAGIEFPGPVGLAAGFDYEAKLTQTLAHWGFGFQTVGTITNHAYEGNPRPMLGRLPQSRSLMVNKGFKNLGANITSQKLANLDFVIPVGISIGRTNSTDLKTQKQSVADIITTFESFEQSKGKHSYYELNISCPNLFGDISFYPSKNLEELLTEVDKLKLKRPVFVKMPIEKSDQEVVQMLEVIAEHSVQGVIFGNLQKDRSDQSLVQTEVQKFAKGNFSGKPTYQRSNELIKLAYSKFGEKLVIIGCGGIFSAEDAYEKITSGASLVQLITGLIFEGPQLVMQINYGLTDLLKRDGFEHIQQAVGARN